MKRKLLALGLGVALSVGAAYALSPSTSSSVASGLTLTSKTGADVDVYCNTIKGLYPVTSKALNLPWEAIILMFGSGSLQCQFYPHGDTPIPSNEIGSASLALTLTRGAISNIKTYNGHSAPTIQYDGTPNSSGAYKGISVTLNS